MIKVPPPAEIPAALDSLKARTLFETLSVYFFCKVRHFYLKVNKDSANPISGFLPEFHTFYRGYIGICL